MKIKEDHFALKTAPEVQAICQPFFKKTGITIFGCVRHYDNGHSAFLTSHAQWSQHYCNKGYSVSKGNVELKPGAHLWSTDDSLTQSALDARELFNIAHRYDIVERGENYYDKLAFGTNAENNNIIDYYMNHSDELKYFVLYFKDKASQLIQKAALKENKLYFKEVAEYGALSKDVPKEHIFLSNRIRHFMLNTSEGSTALSHRELLCVLGVLKGRTASQIAQKINVSSKTVESYIASSKEKLNCSSRAELFDKAWESGITDLLRRFSIQNMVDLGIKS